MNKLNKVLIIIIVMLGISLCTVLGCYLNLKKDYNKLEAQILFSQDGEQLEDTGNFLFQEEGK